MTQSHNLDTTGWNVYPFETQGIKFLSKISPESPMLSRILALPAGMFEAMNCNAISELVGVNLTREQLVAKLQEVNQGASHAVVELV